MDCTKSSFGMGEMKPSLAFALGYAKFSIDSAIVRLYDAENDFSSDDVRHPLISQTIAELRAAAAILEKTCLVPVFHGKPEGEIE